MNAISTPATGVSFDVISDGDPGGRLGYKFLHARQGEDVYRIVLTETSGNVTASLTTYPTGEKELHLTGIVNPFVSLYQQLLPLLSTTTTSRFTPRLQRINAVAGGIDLHIRNGVSGTDYTLQVADGASTNVYRSALAGLAAQINAEPRVTGENQAEYVRQMNELLETMYASNQTITRIEANDDRADVYFTLGDGVEQCIEDVHTDGTPADLVAEFVEIQEESASYYIASAEEQRQEQPDSEAVFGV